MLSRSRSRYTRDAGREANSKKANDIKTHLRKHTNQAEECVEEKEVEKKTLPFAFVVKESEEVVCKVSPQ